MVKTARAIKQVKTNEAVLNETVKITYHLS